MTKKKDYIIKEAELNHSRALGRIHSSSWRVAYRGIIPDKILKNMTPQKRARKFEKYITEGYGYNYVIEVKGKIIGFLTIGKSRDDDLNDEYGEIWGIYLDPEYWRQGYGSRLIRFGFKKLQEMGFTKVSLWVLKKNTNSIKFYKKIGFEKDDKEENLPIGDGVIKIRLIKKMIETDDRSEKKLIKNIENELKKNIDEEYKKGIERFFKDKDLEESNFFCYGVKTSNVRKIGKKYYPVTKEMNRNKFFRFSEKMLNKRNSELRTIVFQWNFRKKNKIRKRDYEIFHDWLKKYVTGWGSCDDFCTHAFGYLIYQYPELITRIIDYWVKSDNRWIRRAAPVVMIYSLKKGKYINHALKIADKLLNDGEDLVQKGVGWMLKIIANTHRDIIDTYLIENYDKIPRVTLRYAIEKFPEKRRKEILNWTKL